MGSELSRSCRSEHESAGQQECRGEEEEEEEEGRDEDSRNTLIQFDSFDFIGRISASGFQARFRQS